MGRLLLLLLFSFKIVALKDLGLFLRNLERQLISLAEDVVVFDLVGLCTLTIWQSSQVIQLMPAATACCSVS
jgi:hypothetical protein